MRRLLVLWQVIGQARAARAEVDCGSIEIQYVSMQPRFVLIHLKVDYIIRKWGHVLQPTQ